MKNDDDTQDIALELPQQLPVGRQTTFDEYEFYPDREIEKVIKKCDCGGYKVFGSNNPAAHSPWCDLLKE